MIEFKFNGSTSIDWLIVLALVALLIVQGWLLASNRTLSTAKKWLRGTLNFLLWLALVAYVVQPVWTNSAKTTHALIVADGVPSSYARQIGDSLALTERFTTKNFKGQFDSVTLVGQAFAPQLFGRLSQSGIRWVPYHQPNELQAIQWKGIVRKGEMQRVTGYIRSSAKQTLRIKYGNRTLDSLSLQEGLQPFALQFPAFAQGRTEAELVLGQQTLDTIRFFSRHTPPLAYQFVLSAPDFESKTLADWLGKQGNTVQLTSTISKDVTNSLAINQAATTRKTKTSDIIITEPTNANNPVVKRAITDGKSVLFINLTNPETEARSINQAVGSGWKVRKISTEATVPISNGLSALPYAITSAINQFSVSGYPVAIQQVNGKVGLSLISETYSLKLSGDSSTYDRIWTAILAPLQPSSKNNLIIQAPLFAGLQEAFQLNNTSVRPASLLIDNDTAALAYSPINELTANASYRFDRAGWHTIQDSLDVYVDDNQSFRSISDQAVIGKFLRAHAKYQTSRASTESVTERKVPEWVWLIVFVVCLTVIWIEPKLN